MEKFSKILIIFVITVVVLVPLSIYCFAYYEAVKPIPGKACPSPNKECELNKDWTAIKILSPANPFVTDIFGKPLIKGCWYLRSKKTEAVFPLAYRSISGSIEVPSGINVGPVEMEKAKSNEGFFKGTEVKKEWVRLRISTGKPDVYVYALILCLNKGELLVEGVNELEAYFHRYKNS